MADSKYGKYLVEIPFHKAGPGALFSTGGDILGGMELNVIYACGYQTGITGLSRKPHVHNYDEAVFFIGSDPYALDDLGADPSVRRDRKKSIFLINPRCWWPTRDSTTAR
jgi:hypothetical protein